MERQDTETVNGTFRSLRLRLHPGSQWRTGPQEDCLEQFAYVITGTLQALSFGAWVSVTAGESFAVRGEGPQLWRNRGDESAELLLVSAL